ncbi:DUF3829 domain-containing protein [Leptotrichia sp. OH3620_COT-345]|uniref:DUF3829 domain-containing protein n=1 Tax=Leptotrichia sp. OH3620_COT-345 TaxID=2491048 RepID=UPI000F654FE6|nr:DUF3829 domain-containing protein [Leptotrichia sp. OH3620_COT-345]RRD39153.1 DUF3829 domain-containing protein [Leptotrichia sp. OH3620_COT-345]
MKIKKLLLMILLLPGLIISCGKQDKEKEKLNKYNEYVKFYNDLRTGKMSKFYNTYIENFSDNDLNFKEPNEKEISLIVTLGTEIKYFSKRTEEIEKIIKKNPEIKEVEEYLTVFLNTLKNEKSVMNEIVNYYKNGEYKKDNFKKGKKLHLKYSENTKKSEEKYIIFKENMEIYMKNYKEESLQLLMNKGEKSQYYMIKFINDTDKFLEKLYESEEGEFPEEDLENLKKLNMSMKETYQKWIEIDKKSIENEKYNVDDYIKFRENSKEIKDMSDSIVKLIEEKSDEIYPQSHKFNEMYEKFINTYNETINKK